MIYPLQIPPAIREVLRDIHETDVERRPNERFLIEQQALIVTPGLGDEIYLTLGGRVLFIGVDDEARTLTEAEEIQMVWGALVIAARRFALDALLALLPARPAEVQPCPACQGERWFAGKIVCFRCRGLGWEASEQQIEAWQESLRRGRA